MAGDRRDDAWTTGASDEGLLPDLDLTKPSIARVYDYLLGGRDHFDVDRRAAIAILNAVPEANQLARDNRSFLQRGVRYLVGEVGIRQLIDIGSGLPSAGNVHEIAHKIDPTVRTVYVDNDRMVLMHARALLANSDTSVPIMADLREPSTIFDHPDTKRLIDFDQPFAVLLGGVLHHLHDHEDPFGVTAHIRGRLGDGCYLLASNFLAEEDHRAASLERAFLEGGLGHGRFRTWEEQRRYFEGLELVEPGLVYANDWRPDETTDRGNSVHKLLAAAIGRKTG